MNSELYRKKKDKRLRIHLASNTLLLAHQERELTNVFQRFASTTHNGP
jgi:hypothetical protein